MADRDEKLIEDIRLLARWEPTSDRRVEICEKAAKRLEEFHNAELCDNCEQTRWLHCTPGGGTQDGLCNWFKERA